MKATSHRSTLVAVTFACLCAAACSPAVSGGPDVGTDDGSAAEAAVAVDASRADDDGAAPEASVAVDASRGDGRDAAWGEGTVFGCGDAMCRADQVCVERTVTGRPFGDFSCAAVPAGCSPAADCGVESGTQCNLADGSCPAVICGAGSRVVGVMNDPYKVHCGARF